MRSNAISIYQCGAGEAQAVVTFVLFVVFVRLKWLNDWLMYAAVYYSGEQRS
jgi:hypothetical protein